MSGTILPLPLLIDHKPTGADISAVNKAIEVAGLPVEVRPATAVPGGADRVICINTTPDFITDYAFLPSVDSKGLPNAIKWALSDAVDDRAITMADMLSEIMGCEVVELEPEVVEQKVRFQ